MTKVGTRVGVMLGANSLDKVVKFLGYGEYIGDTVPPLEAGGFNVGLPNPTLKLDNGKTVYGCETWWGGEEAVRSRLEKYKADGWTIETVDIDDERAKASSSTEL